MLSPKPFVYIYSSDVYPTFAGLQSRRIANGDALKALKISQEGDGVTSIVFGTVPDMPRATLASQEPFKQAAGLSNAEALVCASKWSHASSACGPPRIATGSYILALDF